MRTNSSNDIIKKATGDVPTQSSVVGERKFGAAVAATTDKMGITTGGALARGFIWGLVIGAGVVMGIGLWKDKISFTYSK